MRDEYREDWDRTLASPSSSPRMGADLLTSVAGRGGWGHLKNREEVEAQRRREVEETYRDDHDAGGAGRDVPTGAGDPDEVR